jgi:hypothetical protein
MCRRPQLRAQRTGDEYANKAHVCVKNILFKSTNVKEAGGGNETRIKYTKNNVKMNEFVKEQTTKQMNE